MYRLGLPSAAPAGPITPAELVVFSPPDDDEIDAQRFRQLLQSDAAPNMTDPTVQAVEQTTGSSLTPAALDQKQISSAFLGVLGSLVTGMSMYYYKRR